LGHDKKENITDFYYTVKREVKREVKKYLNNAEAIAFV